MPTFRDEFQELAAELIGDEFADFRRLLSFTVTTSGTYDPVTESTTGGTTANYNYQAIPQPVDIKEWQGTDIQVTDIAVTYVRSDALIPNVSDVCAFDVQSMQVKAVMLDAANATVKLVLRAL